MVDYSEFLNTKSHLDYSSGFKANFIPDYLFDFQKYLLEWSCRQGRSAQFADCGLGKTILQLTWAENVTRGNQ